MRRIDYRLDADTNTNTLGVRAGQSRWRYAYFDATAAREFVLECLWLALDQEPYAGQMKPWWQDRAS